MARVGAQSRPRCHKPLWQLSTLRAAVGETDHLIPPPGRDRKRITGEDRPSSAGPGASSRRHRRLGPWRYYESAIAVPGPETLEISEVARRDRLHLVVGVIERDGGALYCTALMFGPDGSLPAKHPKLMPTALERLVWGFGDGSKITGSSTAPAAASAA
jgi:hypothetical protein